MRYCLVSPELVVILDEDGEPVQRWHDTEIFGELVLSGAPLYRDHDGVTYFDLTLNDDGSIMVNTNDPETDAAQIDLPLAAEPRATFLRWLDEH
ncbi:hypothetical protein AB0H34_37235 [Saccharopolyspora shandongensis]|uniref:hypothetical protein n=1 Tax=Saccharopolyspora shandongensis TaxID=418495 RepID=UPI0033C4DC60